MLGDKRLAQGPRSKPRTRREPAAEPEILGTLPLRTGTGTGAQERWPQILDAAMVLFHENGFTGTSIKDVSDKVGLLKGSLYYYIQSKEDLLFHILKGLHDDGEDMIASVRFESGDPLDELQRYLAQGIVFAADNARRLSIFLRDFDHVAKDRQPEIISERDMYVRTARRLIEEGQAEGCIAATADSHMAATFLMGAVSSVHEWMRPSRKRPAPPAAQEIARWLIRGIAQAPAPDQA